MINAKEALELSIANTDSVLNSIVAEIEKRIKEQALIGSRELNFLVSGVVQYSINYELAIQSILTTNGYTVVKTFFDKSETPKSNPQRDFYTVTW